ncbi:MAG: hypothetical protein GOMPHAMPRED_002896 [Gomphillus americanus]|uniref:Abscission/NoCut checkpoint regulator n=1 Tax=Gomphillus americanus TaxID=1940652 RepID=A0A8H3EFG4_9LECA|nr:MAG: hypothetical protein GOMPHAMPRED_002896 [Gomphillus americanus]
MSGPDRDNNLLNRFNALKSSPINARTSSSPTRDPLEDDLAARFLRFSSSEQRTTGSAKDSGMKSPSVTAVDEDDKTLEDLLAEIGPQDQWLLESDNTKDIQNLLDEARASMPAPVQETETSLGSNEETESMEVTFKAAADLSKEAQDEAENSLHAASHLIGSNSEGEERPEFPTEEEEAALSLQRILDELSLENSLSNPDLLSKQEPPPTSAETNHIPQFNSKESGSPEVELDLPSAPGTIPSQPNAKGLQLDQFHLPSAPTNKPSKKLGKTNLPIYTNEEIDSWCVICNDDATARCSGCDGNLYCTKCWREGHTGPDVGYEEKRHKWTKYVKPR